MKNNNFLLKIYFFHEIKEGKSTRISNSQEK